MEHVRDLKEPGPLPPEVDPILVPQPATLVAGASTGARATPGRRVWRGAYSSQLGLAVLATGCVVTVGWIGLLAFGAVRLGMLVVSWF